MLVACDVAEHDIAHVCIDASASTLAAVGLDIMGSTVFEIHLVLYKLVPAEYDGGLDLPHEEAVFLVNVVGDILLHGEVEGEYAGLVIGQRDVFHI